MAFYGLFESGISEKTVLGKPEAKGTIAQVIHNQP